MTNYYTDTILGDWKLKKRGKEYLEYERQKEIELHKQHAIKNLNEGKEIFVWGKVVLRQEKKIHVASSRESLYNFLDFTEKTEKQDVI